MRSLACLIVLTAVACTGDPPPNQTNKCTMLVYDLCSTEHDCISTMCHLFQSDGFQVCTQACDATTPCPNDSTGAAGTCNAMGICKPAVANDCTL
jgi:hypothetical protein